MSSHYSRGPQKSTRSTQISKKRSSPKNRLLNPAAADNNYKHLIVTTVITARNQRPMLHLPQTLCKVPALRSLQQHQTWLLQPLHPAHHHSQSHLFLPEKSRKVLKTEVTGHRTSEVTVLPPPTITWSDRTIHFKKHTSKKYSTDYFGKARLITSTDKH